MHVQIYVLTTNTDSNLMYADLCGVRYNFVLCWISI